MPKSVAEISRFMSLVLRHQPEAIGLTLDAQGWAGVEDLVRRSQSSDTPLTVDLVLEVVRTSEKKRFRVSDDGLRIRANQGHSVDVDLALPPTTPPEILYHGTALQFLDAIRAEGLRPGARRHVHLSAERETAERVGRRRGAPVVLIVAAGAMHRAGRRFLLAENGVWLTDSVPAEFVSAEPGPV
jgi:putative RNA 2'-phosphotransferase